MKIKKIIINSFRGLENVEFELDGKLNVFTGDNKLGKSTIIDSVMWVLCGETLVNGVQDQDNRNQNDLKKELNVILEMEDGIVLERKYKDIWKEDEDGILRYSRTQNDFFVNGAKYKKGEYFEYIKDTLKLNKRLKVDKFKLLRCLMDYNYFCNEETQISRNFITKDLLNLATDEELLSDDKFLLIREDMRIQKYADGKCINRYRTEINKTDSDIKEKNDLLKSLKNSVDTERLSKYQELIDERTKLLIEDVRYNEQYLALNQLLGEIQTNIQDVEKNSIKAKFEKEKEIQDLINRGNKCNADITRISYEIKIDETKFRNIENELNDLRLKKDQVSQLNFNEIHCPKCDELINKNEKNTWKKEKEEIISNLDVAIENKEYELKEINIDIENKNKNIEEIENGKKEYGKQYHSAVKELEILKQEIESNSTVKELLLKKENVTKELNEFITNFNTDKNNKIIALNLEINELSNMNDIVKHIETTNTLIQYLKTQKATLENKISLVKEFKVLRSNVIKENISKVFTDVEIEIIEESDKTGCTEEVCYAKLKGVEYKAINDGHRYLVGITIIENIKKALGLEDLPIVFDKFADIGKETLKEIENITNAQILTTLVSDSKKIILNNNK